MQLTPNFHFWGDCDQAIDLYCRAFDAQVLTLLRYRDARGEDFVPPPGQEERIYHAELLLAGKLRVMLSDEETPPPASTVNRLSMVVTLETAQAVRQAAETLGEGGKIRAPLCSTTYASAFVSLIDRFGIRWEIMTEQTAR
jgi:PhnB protein